MKVKKSIKENLISLLKQVQINGNPESEQFKKALVDYQELKKFIEGLEIE